MIKSNHLKRCLLGLGFILIAGCLDKSYDEAKKTRIQLASDAKDGEPIIIGVSWKNADSETFVKGVKLAVKEINAEGILLNSPLQIIINDSESIFNDSNLSVEARNNAVLNAANSFAANPNLVAVIGHSSSGISSLASVVYENNGILFLAPIARYSKLTGHNFKYTFRTIPINEETGIQVAEYAAYKGYKKIAVINSRDDSSVELTNTFSIQSVDKYDVDIVYRHSFFDDALDITSLIISLKDIQQLDAIFIAASSKMSAKIYQKMREMGIKLPVIGGETFDNKSFSTGIKQWENDGNVGKSSTPTLFNKQSPSGEVFVKKFEKEYGDAHPDYLAALGYDTIKLLAHGIQLAQSTIPLEIATTLRYMAACKGVAGNYQFKPNGDLKSKPLYFKHWENGAYVYEQLHAENITDAANIETCYDGIDRDHDSVPNIIDFCPDSTKEEVTKGVELKGTMRGCIVDGTKKEQETN